MTAEFTESLALLHSPVTAPLLYLSQHLGGGICTPYRIPARTAPPMLCSPNVLFRPPIHKLLHLLHLHPYNPRARDSHTIGRNRPFPNLGDAVNVQFQPILPDDTDLGTYRSPFPHFSRFGRLSDSRLAGRVESSHRTRHEQQSAVNVIPILDVRTFRPNFIHQIVVTWYSIVWLVTSNRVIVPQGLLWFLVLFAFHVLILDLPRTSGTRC